MTLPEHYARSALSPPSDLPIDHYIEQEVSLGRDSDLKGQVSFDLFPQVRYFLRCCADPEVQSVVLMCSAQSGKTKGVELFLIHKIKTNPGPTIWYSDVQSSAQETSTTRLQEDFADCSALEDEWPKDRNRKRWGLIRFTSMDLWVRGAEAKINRERTSASTVLCDERRNYPPGAMASIRNRYKTFRESKEISFSTAGEEHDELHQAFLQGTMTFFHWSCLKCGHRQPFRFGRQSTALFPSARECGGVIWEKSKATHPSDNVWVFSEVEKTVRYQCENPACKWEYRNYEKPLLLATMNERNDFGAVQTNPMASRKHVSMHWNELYMPWKDASWEMTVEKFLKAKINLKLTHNEEPLKVWVQESDGCPWRVDTEKIEEGAVLARRGNYMLGEQWPAVVGEKSVLILTFDVQLGYLVYVVRQWKPGGASRLIECGTCLDFESLRLIQQRLLVKDKCVWGDCSYDTLKVYRACQSYNWIAMVGDEAKEFARKVWVENIKRWETIRTFWKMSPIDPASGTKLQGRSKIQRVFWSNNHYLELLFLFLIPGESSGEARHHAPTWEIPVNISHDYIAQMSAIERYKETDAEGTVTWLWRWTSQRHDFADCEQMSVVAADQSELFIAPEKV
jgi:hypothetical protein